MARTTKARAKANGEVKTVHVTLLVDRSGSMATVRSDVIAGINTFIGQQQAQPGKCLLTVHQFDSQGFDTLFDAMAIEDVRNATEDDFVPRGSTPLLDAVGKAISFAQARCDGPDGKNEQHIVTILTDGLENASREHTRASIRALIAQKEAVGWVFTYLGANVDAYAEANAIGIHVGATQNFVPDAVGIKAAFHSHSGAVSNARSYAARGTTLGAGDFYGKTGKGADDDWARRTVPPSAPKPQATGQRGWEKPGG